MHIDRFFDLSLEFSRDYGEAPIDLDMEDHADGTARVVMALIMVMECSSKDGEKQKEDKNDGKSLKHD